MTSREVGASVPSPGKGGLIYGGCFFSGFEGFLGGGFINVGSHPSVLRAYSCLGAQGSFQKWIGASYRILRIESASAAYKASSKSAIQSFWPKICIFTPDKKDKLKKKKEEVPVEH